MRRIVIKVGSAVLSENGELALNRMSALVDLIAKLKQNNEVVLVSSGAVSAGYSLLKLDKKVIENKQALASIGQPLLMRHYKEMFNKFDILCSQVLVTAANFNDKTQAIRLKSSVEVLLRNNVIPIVNENDATSTQELVLGDNDQLSAYVAHNFDADILSILSDIDGYYDCNPNKHLGAKIIKNICKIEKSELEREVTPNNEFATGGIVTKLKAAAYAMEHGVEMFLASGFNLNDVENFLVNNIHDGGTLFKKDYM